MYGEVLLGDPFDRNVINIHFIPLDQIKQKIERPFKDLEFNLIIHWQAVELGSPSRIFVAACEEGKRFSIAIYP